MWKNIFFLINWERERVLHIFIGKNIALYQAIKGIITFRSSEIEQGTYILEAYSIIGPWGQLLRQGHWGFIDIYKG